VLSNKTNNRSCMISGRNASDFNLTKAVSPSPGQYQSQESIGRQLESCSETMPAYKFAESVRWSQTASTFNNHFETPPSTAYKYLTLTARSTKDSTRMPWGEGIGCKIDPRSRRWDVHKGLPGERLEKIGPGPGGYESTTSAFGDQIAAHKESMPRAVIGKATSDGSRKMFISSRHLRSNLGTQSLSASYYQPQSSIGPQLVAISLLNIKLSEDIDIWHAIESG